MIMHIHIIPVSYAWFGAITIGAVITNIIIKGPVKHVSYIINDYYYNDYNYYC